MRALLKRLSAVRSNFYGRRSPVRSDLPTEINYFFAVEKSNVPCPRLSPDDAFPKIPRMGRKPKRAKKRMGAPQPRSKQKSAKFYFAAEPRLSKVIQRIVDEHFDGNFSEFAREARQMLAADMEAKRSAEIEANPQVQSPSR